MNDLGGEQTNGASAEAPSSTGTTSAAATRRPSSSAATPEASDPWSPTTAATPPPASIDLNTSTSEDELEFAERLKKKIRSARLKPSGHLENLRPKISQISEVYQRTILNDATASMLEKFERIALKNKDTEVTRDDLLAFLGHLIDSFGEFALATR